MLHRLRVLFSLLQKFVLCDLTEASQGKNTKDTKSQTSDFGPWLFMVLIFAHSHFQILHCLWGF